MNLGLNLSFKISFTSATTVSVQQWMTLGCSGSPYISVASADMALTGRANSAINSQGSCISAMKMGGAGSVGGGGGQNQFAISKLVISGSGMDKALPGSGKTSGSGTISKTSGSASLNSNANPSSKLHLGTTNAAVSQFSYAGFIALIGVAIFLF